jgi:hypothetical protein
VRPVGGAIVPAIVVALGVAACGPSRALLPAAEHGDPIALGQAPTPAECLAAIRRETAAAKAIRGELRIDGLLATDVAVGTAANDPDASIELLGIPLTPAEARIVEPFARGSEPEVGVQQWVTIGAPDRFGGLWYDPPGGDRLVVAVLGSDPATVGLARCVAPPDTAYVHAVRSLAEGYALQERVTDGTEQLRTEGIDVTLVGYDERRGVVTVGVETLTDAAVEAIRSRYGDDIVVEETRGVGF